MPKFLVVRDLPDVSLLSDDALRTFCEKTCATPDTLKQHIEWVSSYVTGNRLYCVYLAPNAEILREQAALSGLPARRITEIRQVLRPGAAERRLSPTRAAQ